MDPMIFVIGALVIAAMPLLWAIAAYNGFVRLRNHCNEAWSNIETELKRRYNLIPNLVETVKGYAAHERQLLTELTKAREACVRDEGTPAHQAATETEMVRRLGAVLARIENYPELKADQNFLALQRELSLTEDRIQAARRFYNANVRENNNKVQSFPSNLIASAFNFPLRDFFEVEDARHLANPQVQL
jgi:LemA protein